MPSWPAYRRRRPFARRLVMAASSAVAAMSPATVSDLLSPGSPEFIALAATLAIMVGVVAVLSGLLRLGCLAQFFSE